MLEWEAFNAGMIFYAFSENVTEGIQLIAEKAHDAMINESCQKLCS